MINKQIQKQLNQHLKTIGLNELEKNIILFLNNNESKHNLFNYNDIDLFKQIKQIISKEYLNKLNEYPLNDITLKFINLFINKGYFKSIN